MQGDFRTWLGSHRCGEGVAPTHTSIDKPKGRFHVKPEDEDEFYTLYLGAMRAGEDVHLTERPPSWSPVRFDLDLRFSAPPPTHPGNTDEERPPQRVYVRDNHIRRIVMAVSRMLHEFLDVPVEALSCYVMEKPAPIEVRGGIIKDGVHLQFPGVVTETPFQFFLREKLLQIIPDILGGLGITNPWTDVVDDKIIELNNWQLYGSRKPGYTAYAVTTLYDFDPSASSAASAGSGASSGASSGAGSGAASAAGGSGAAGGDLVERAPPLITLDVLRKLSVRGRTAADGARFATGAAGAEASEWIRCIYPTVAGRKRDALNQQVFAPTINRFRNMVSLEELTTVRKLTLECLGVERAETYDTWVRVGWALRNIDHRLLESWVDISKRSNKYVEGECPRLWHSMRIGGLGIGTLHMWARQDSPERYREILRVDLVRLIKGSLSATHYDVARVVHHLYRYEFACSNIRNRVWYEFRDHRWRECDSAYALRRRLSNDVFREYVAAKQLLAQRSTHTDDEAEQKEMLQQCKKLADIALKLKVTAFKDNVLKECCELFYREHFEDLLDSDVNLLGFENGVYDLANHEFREGRPDDHVSFSTGINHVAYDADHPTVQAVTRFWESVHPEPDIREYVLLTLSSCLSGHIREERFHIWTGCGSNGKSLSVSLLEKALGQYCCKFPVTLLTQKRAASSSATPEIARAKGRRFAVLQEPSEDERLNVGQLKELSGGDTVQTRELFKPPCEWRPQFKLFLLCNQLPHVPSDDGGTWRRIRVVEFGSKFVENPSPERPNEFPIDMELTGKLDGWKEHFMAILIQYYRRYVTSKLAEPPAVMQCTHDYQRTNDHMADFVECCIERAPQPVPAPGPALAPGPTASMSIDDAMSEIKVWITADNVPIKAPKKQLLQRYLDRVLGKGAPGAKGGSRQLHYVGWRIRDRYGGGEMGEGEGDVDDA